MQKRYAKPQRTIGIIVYISKTKEDEGHIQIPLRLLESLVFTLMRLNLALKNKLVFSYYMTNVAQEKGKVQIDWGV